MCMFTSATYLPLDIMPVRLVILKNSACVSDFIFSPRFLFAFSSIDWEIAKMKYLEEMDWCPLADEF